MDEALGRWINEVCTKARNTAENVIQVISDNATRRTLLGRPLESIKNSRQLEQLLIESAKHKFLVTECLLQWTNNLVDVNDNLHYYDDGQWINTSRSDGNIQSFPTGTSSSHLTGVSGDRSRREVPLSSDTISGGTTELKRGVSLQEACESGVGRKTDGISPRGWNEAPLTLNFRQVFLRSHALETLVRTIVKANLEKGPSKDDDLIIPGKDKEDGEAVVLKKCLKQIFTLCISGPRNLHDDIISLILNMKPMDDTHPELVVQLISTLKINWKDDLLLEQRKRIATEVLSIDLQNTSIADRKSTGLLDRLLLYKDGLENILSSTKSNDVSYNNYRDGMDLLRTMLNKCKLECHHSLASIENADADLKSVYMKDTEPLNTLIAQCDDKIAEFREGIATLEKRKKLLLEELQRIEVEMEMKLEMLSIKENELSSARREIDAMNRTYIKTLNSDTIKDNYLRKSNDINKIKTLTLELDEFMKQLYNSTSVELENKYTDMLSNVNNIVKQHIQYLLDKLDSETKIAKDIVKNLEKNRDSKLANDLNNTYISIEQIWSDFIDFHSDNKAYIPEELYYLVKKNFSDAKTLISKFL